MQGATVLTPPDQIQLIHGERYMKTMVTPYCSFLYGWETAYQICGSVTFRGCIGYMKTLVTLHLLNLYGWETA